MAAKYSTSDNNSLSIDDYQATLRFCNVSDDDEEPVWLEEDSCLGREGGSNSHEVSADHPPSYSCYCIDTNSCDECDHDNDKLPLSTPDETSYPNFVKPLEYIENEDLVCLICQMVAIGRPLQSHCCGKLYCQDCVHKFQKHNNSPNPICPTCRKPGVQFFEDKRANRSILGLQVYCDLRKKGCKWHGTLSDRQSHAERCNYRLTPCPNDCGRTVRYLQLPKHLHRSCPNRLYMCHDCGESGKWVYMYEVHSKECTSKTVSCANEGCTEKVKRSNLATHQLTCSKKVIECPFRDIGCMTTFKREDSAKHNKAYKKKHNAYALTRARRPFTQKGHLDQIAPVVLTVDGFSRCNTHRSLPFFTSLGGYKMSLLVSRTPLDGSVDVSVCMVAGEYDRTLHWPLEANVTVQLLNQVEDDAHLTLDTDIFVVKDSFYTKRDESSNYFKGIEIGSFAVFDDSEATIDNEVVLSPKHHVAAVDTYACIKQKAFLVDDCLYFRVSCSDNRD